MKPLYNKNTTLIIKCGISDNLIFSTNHSGQARRPPGGAVVEAERRLRVAQDLFVGCALRDTFHFVHRVDNLGIRWHSGLILSESGDGRVVAPMLRRKRRNSAPRIETREWGSDKGFIIVLPTKHLYRMVLYKISLAAQKRSRSMANERTYPCLPCGDMDESIAFYESLGFKKTYRQVRPNPERLFNN